MQGAWKYKLNFETRTAWREVPAHERHERIADQNGDITVTQQVNLQRDSFMSARSEMFFYCYVNTSTWNPGK